MTKTEARAIVADIQAANIRGWLDQAARIGKVYYHQTYRNKAGDSHVFTLATIAGGGVQTPYIDFLWPSPVPQYTTDDPGEEARRVLGSYSDSLDVAAKSIDFTFKRRGFAAGGGGMDMVFHTLYTLAHHSGWAGDVNALERINMDRS